MEQLVCLCHPGKYQNWYNILVIMYMKCYAIRFDIYLTTEDSSNQQWVASASASASASAERSARCASCAACRCARHSTRPTAKKRARCLGAAACATARCPTRCSPTSRTVALRVSRLVEPTVSAVSFADYTASSTSSTARESARLRREGAALCVLRRRRTRHTRHRHSHTTSCASSFRRLRS